MMSASDANRSEFGLTQKQKIDVNNNSIHEEKSKKED
jgi:hypothetical protein